MGNGRVGQAEATAYSPGSALFSSWASRRRRRSKYHTAPTATAIGAANMMISSQPPWWASKGATALTERPGFSVTAARLPAPLTDYSIAQRARVDPVGVVLSVFVR